MYPPPIVFILAVVLSIVLIKDYFSPKVLALIIGSLVLVVMFVMNRMFCKMILAFGADMNCNALHNFYGYGGTFVDWLLTPIVYMEHCGASLIANSYMNHKDVTYINKKVVRILRGDGCCSLRLADNQIMHFDKCIITTPYESYKDVIALTEDEVSTLAGTKYFDFYSTLVVPRNASKIDASIESIGSIKIEDGAYLVASHEPIDIKPETYAFKKSYKWRMPRIYDAVKRRKINTDVTRTVFFAGKEFAGNGMNYCMEYSLALSKLF